MKYLCYHELIQILTLIGTTLISCNRCGDKLEKIDDLKNKIKTCDKKKCACKQAKFQKECTKVFECSAEDFISVTHIELHIHPVTPAYTPPTYQGPVRQTPRYGGSWLCINDPLHDCDCNLMLTGQCTHSFHGCDI